MNRTRPKSSRHTPRIHLPSCKVRSRRVADVLSPVFGPDAFGVAANRRDNGVWGQCPARSTGPGPSPRDRWPLG